MWEDPIVAEVRRTREQLAAQFNFDVKAIFADLRKRQAALGSRLIPQKRRTEPVADGDSGHRFGSPDSTPIEPGAAK